MNKTLKVTAKSGCLCPKEGKPREYIEAGSKFIEVPDTPYYRRMIKDGSLDTAETIKARKAAEAEAKAKKEAKAEVQGRTGKRGGAETPNAASAGRAGAAKAASKKNGGSK